MSCRWDTLAVDASATVRVAAVASQTGLFTNEARLTVPGFEDRTAFAAVAATVGVAEDRVVSASPADSRRGPPGFERCKWRWAQVRPGGPT